MTYWMSCRSSSHQDSERWHHSEPTHRELRSSHGTPESQSELQSCSLGETRRTKSPGQGGFERRATSFLALRNANAEMSSESSEIVSEKAVLMNEVQKYLKHVRETRGQIQPTLFLMQRTSEGHSSSKLIQVFAAAHSKKVIALI
jgi:hypothetical protein